DVSGFRYDDLALREPKDGRDVKLSIDARIQKLAEEALGGRNGAAVVLDPSCGDVLAMASTPGFDPNQFIPSIPAAEWKVLMDNPAKPMINRAISGAFPPGSIFKPIVALATLQNELAGAQTAFSCPGYFELGRSRFRCWYTPGHGLLNMRQAIQHSCNVYFFRLGLLCGNEPIYHMATAMGLGQKMGISLDAEVTGLVPNDGWKRQTQGDGWRDGDTCNMSIGQGFLTVTPLQMAMATAAIANGGKLYRPRLVLGVQSPDRESFHTIQPEILNTLHWPADAIKLVQGGMFDVVESAEGTGRLAKIPGIHAAGKTGTAEVGRKHEGKKLGWMIAYAPFEKPKYAIALMVEDAVTGGTTAAPIMQRLLMALFKELEPGKGQG
ncbi:MAG: penicillin-binding transpeptidase domain-containing protein, partial [Lentisphaerota bacterium]